MVRNNHAVVFNVLIIIVVNCVAKIYLENEFVRRRSNAITSYNSFPNNISLLPPLFHINYYIIYYHDRRLDSRMMTPVLVITFQFLILRYKCKIEKHWCFCGEKGKLCERLMISQY